MALRDGENVSKLDDRTLARIQALREQFERELAVSKYSKNTKNVMNGYLKQFVRWLGGTWSPSDHDGSLTP